MCAVTTDVLREVMRGFKRVSNEQLYAVLNVHDRRERSDLRARLRDMCKRGEAVRIGTAMYEYNQNYSVAAKSGTFSAIWRFVRTQKPGWSISYAAQLTRVSYTQVARYCAWLENEGFISRHGKDGRTTLFRATEKADRSPETPYPPITDKDPFERENAAATRLATLMLCYNPYQTGFAAEIVKNCKVLLARFSVTQNENENGGEDK
jgi:hypothetical protein